jgi:Ca2+-binding RTX toxin-like protein
MTTLSDVKTVPATGLLHIDGILDNGPGWNWITPARNVLYYTFALNDGSPNQGSLVTGPVTAFNTAQQAATTTLLNYVSQITGIVFTPTTDGRQADIHFAAGNITDPGFSGYCSWNWNYTSSGDTITSYTPDAYVYLDNVQYNAVNSVPTASNGGWELILHEMGHALGLKHSFSGNITLPSDHDNTAYTLMSYTPDGATHTSYSPYDIAALMWLYGGDGLGGALGQGAPGQYLVGSEKADRLSGGGGADVFEGGAGDDVIFGGGGIDKVVYRHLSTEYSFTASGNTVVAQAAVGNDGTDTLVDVERLVFADKSLAFDFAGAAGVTARILGAVFGPAAVKNAAYAGIGLKLLDAGTSPDALMQLALDTRLGAGFGPAAEVQLLYRNLTGTDPSPAELAHLEPGRIHAGVLGADGQPAGLERAEHRPRRPQPARAGFCLSKPHKAERQSQPSCARMASITAL